MGGGERSTSSRLRFLVFVGTVEGCRGVVGAGGMLNLKCFRILECLPEGLKSLGFLKIGPLRLC